MRSRRLAEYTTWSSSANQQFRIQYIKKRVLSVLLRHPTATIVPSLFNLDYAREYHKLIKCKDESYSYYAGIAWDSHILSSVPGLQSYRQVVCPDTMDPMIDYVEKAGWFVSIGTIKDPLSRLFTKGLQCKCYTRRPAVVTKAPKKSDKKDQIDVSNWGLLNAKIRELDLSLSETCMPLQEKKATTQHLESLVNCRKAVCQLTACTLLGNYKHADPLSKPSLMDTRKFIYNEFVINDPVNFTFASSMIKTCWMMCRFVTREYTVYALRQLPNMRHAIHPSLFDVDEFERIVIEACDSFRVLFKKNIQKVRHCSQWPSLFGLIEHHFTKHQKRLTQFKRSKDPINEDLVRLLTKYPLVPVPIHLLFKNDKGKMLNKMNENDEHIEDYECDEYDDDDDNGFNPVSMPYTARHQHIFRQIDDKKRKASIRKDHGIQLEKYMPVDHIQMVNELVKRHMAHQNIKDKTYTGIDTLFWFVTRHVMGQCFMIDGEVCDRVVRLLSLMHQRKYGHRFKCEQVSNLQSTEPYVYTLIHACLIAIEETSLVLVMGNLPYHYREAQVENLTRVYPELKGGIHDMATCLIYCKYCETLFVRVRGFDDPKSACITPTANNEDRQLISATNTMARQDESHYLKMFIDLDAMSRTRSHPQQQQNEDRIECYRKRRGAKEGCINHQLCRVSLLGRMVKFGDKLIMMCPSCTFPMEYDSRLCAYTPEYGVVCSYCTRDRERLKFKTKKCVIAELGIQSQCIGCGIQLSKASSMYVYPMGIVLCSGCSVPQVSDAVSVCMENTALPKTRESLTRVVVQALSSLKKDRHMWHNKQFRMHGNQTWKQRHSQSISKSNNM